jgi:hypothetical protein
MARKNRKLGSRKSKTYDTSTAPICVHGRPPIAYRRISRGDIKPTPKFTRSAIPYPSLSGVVTLPILFHVVYEGELTDDIKDEARASINNTISGANSILEGDPSSASTFLSGEAERLGFTMPINDPEHGVDSNIRLTLADRIAKKDLMPFIPYNTHVGYYLDSSDPDSNYAGGVEIPGYEPSSYTEEQILALRLAYEEATEETIDAAYAALQEAEADYYLFLTDEPGILFYKFDSDLSENYEGGTDKLNAIRDLEAGFMVDQGISPSNFFYYEVDQNFHTTRLLAESINSKIPCIQVLTNTGGIGGGAAGDSGLGLAQSDVYSKHFRLFSLKYDDVFMPFGLAHELLHYFGTTHGWETVTMRGRARLSGLSNKLLSFTNFYGGASHSTSEFVFDYDFVPPFVYNDAGDSYENISDNEKTFVENIINNYLPQFFADSPIFIESTSSVSASNYNNTINVSIKKFDRGYPVEVAALMGILPTFWGGSYIEIDGQKKFVINPTEAASRSSRNTPLSIGDTYEGGLLFYIDEEAGTGLVAAMEDLPGTYEWGCSYQNVSGADGQDIGTGLQNTMDITNQGCATQNGGVTAAQAALDYESGGYNDWFLPSLDELEEMYNTIGNGGPEGNIGGFSSSGYWSSSESYSNYAGRVSFGSGGTNHLNKDSTARVRVIRSVVLPEIVSENTLYRVGDEIDGIGIIGSIDVNYISAYVVANTFSTSDANQSLGNGLFQPPLLNIDGNQIIYATPGSDTYAEELAAVNQAKLDYDYMYSVNPDAFEVDKMYGFRHSSGSDAWGYNPITQGIENYPRKDEISGGTWYEGSNLYFIGRDLDYPLPEYIATPEPVPANRKGPRINIYNPVCLPSNRNKLNIAFGIGLGWYDPFYPKFPEDTLVEDMFNEENCPCLYQEQSYKDRDSEGNLVTKTFTVLDSNGDMLDMEDFKSLAYTSISDTLAERSIMGLRMSMRDIFQNGKWFNTITDVPYEVVVPNFPVYIGFSRDSVIPYNIKGGHYRHGEEYPSISPIDDDSIFRCFGQYASNILYRYYTTGNTDPSSNLYNPFKVEGDYDLSIVSPQIDFGSSDPQGDFGMTDKEGYLYSSGALPLFRQPNNPLSPFQLQDSLYGPINSNYILNIMHYKGVGPSLPCAITKGQAENLSSQIGNSVGNLMNMKNYSILVGYSSSLGPADPLTSVVSAQTYINDAVDFIVDYDVSTYQGGCTDPISPNYDPNATVDNGTCIEPIYGCIDPTANNYDEGANTDDGSCIFYSLAPIPLYAKHVCNDTTTPVCNLYDNSEDIAVNGGVAGIAPIGSQQTGNSYLYANNAGAISDYQSLLSEVGVWSDTALAFISSYQYNCDENPLASEVEGPDNLTGGCVNIEDNSLCIYPSVDYFHCSILEAGDGLSLLEGYMNQEDFTMTCEDGGTPGIGRNVNNSFFIIGTILLEDVLFTSLGVSYVGKFISDLDGTLYEFSSTKEINRSNPLFFRNQLSLDNLSQAEKDLKNMSKIKESLKKIINFTN